MKRMGVLILACWAAVAGATEVRTVTLQQYLTDRIAGGPAVTLDLRDEASYLAGHIPGSVRVDPDRLGEQVLPIPKSLPVFIVCGCGAVCSHAPKAAETLQAMGFKNTAALDLPRGFGDWTRADLPIETAPTLLATALERAFPQREPSTEPAPKFVSQEKILLILILPENLPKALKDASDPLIALKPLFPKMKVEKVQAGSRRGKALIREAGVRVLPAVLLDPKTAGTGDIERAITMGIFLRISGGRLVANPLLVPPLTLAETRRSPRRLEFFFMSYCPYGNAAARKLLEAKAQGLLPPDLQVEFRYIVEVKNPDPAEEASGARTILVSVHGDTEIQEDARQRVIQSAFPDRFPAYFLARSPNLSSPWEDAARQAGLDPAEVERRVAEEGARLLVEDALFTSTYRIAGSPTFVWENLYIAETAQAAERLLQVPAGTLKWGEGDPSCR